jgi:LAO/AO transport system kinase
VVEKTLIEGLRRGEPRALAKLITRVENREPDYRAVLDAVYPRTGRAVRIGITGPPGAGKSTLVDKLVALYRRDGRRVGILACDPTSPFSGGAVLGDRIRMQSLRDDEGVFIRSLATRGSLGGLSTMAHEAALLVEAAGVEIIVFETIGVGQVEIDVVQAADTVVVVLTPQSGDAIQALKAGLMEIADVFVMNKADQGGADRAAQALQLALRPDMTTEMWLPPILKVSAVKDEGIDRLKDALERHRAFLGEEGLGEKRRARLRDFLRRIVEEELRRELWDLQGLRFLDDSIERVVRGEVGPFTAAQGLLNELKRKQ